MVVEIKTLPEFEPARLKFKTIPAFQYAKTLGDELGAGTVTKDDAIHLYEQMLAIRSFEEMILALRSQAYAPLQGFDYRGPTHLSIGQEATAVGACSTLDLTDYITSTHRGHGDGIAKGCMAIWQRTDAQLREVLGLGDDDETPRPDLEEQALELHLFRTAAELFGKEDGYCRGRGGGMHIADRSVGHLGANAIVGGSLGIATGAALAARYTRNKQVVTCFAGDGSYANGVVLESLNFAAQEQFMNDLAEDRYGLPVVYLIVNNQYGMTGQQRGEVSGLDYLARRAAGFSMDLMHAEVVNGMDVLAVRDAVTRAVKQARKGHGPALCELICYRFFGHSLSDPRNEYRCREEEAAWKEVDPVKTYPQALVDASVCTQSKVKGIEKRIRGVMARAAVRAAESPDPKAGDVTRFLFSDGSSDTVPEEFANPKTPGQVEKPERQDGQISMKQAIKEAMIEEMARDKRVIFYGEDVADYGGAFKVTKGLLEMFGRERISNAPISEAAIVGTGVGAAMTGLRPIVELMYSDFEFQAGDQISNQAAKWSFMSGGQTSVPMVIRTSTGAGKGYGGQHSQSLESHSTHTPGLKVVVPSTPYDAKGLLKTAIRDDNPVMFVESQNLYNVTGEVPEDEYTIPFGVADIKREGGDVTVVAWGYLVSECLAAAETLAAEHDLSVEVIDPRTLAPLDIDAIVESVKKTGRLVVASQATRTGSFTGEIAAQVQEAAFDYLDAPILRIGAVDSISPQSQVLEKAYLPYAEDVVAAVRGLYQK